MHVKVHNHWSTQLLASKPCLRHFAPGFHDMGYGTRKENKLAEAARIRAEAQELKNKGAKEADRTPRASVDTHRKWKGLENLSSIDLHILPENS